MDWLSLATGGMNLIGSLFGTSQGVKAVEKQNQGNMALAEYAYQKDLDMWERQNAYNTPLEQMQRLKDAGLNPNLMYGQGTTGNASSAPSFNSPNMQAYTSFGDLGAGAASQALMQGLSTMSSIEKNNAETANIRQNTENMQVQQELTKQQTITQAYVNAKSETEREFWRTQMVANLANIDSSTQRNLSQTELTNEQTKRYAALTPLVQQQLETSIAQQIFDLNYLSPAKLQNIKSDTLYKNLISSLTKVKTSIYENDLEFSNSKLPFKDSMALLEFMTSEDKAEIIQAEKDLKQLESKYRIKTGSGVAGLLSGFAINALEIREAIQSYLDKKFKNSKK